MCESDRLDQWISKCVLRNLHIAKAGLRGFWVWRTGWKVQSVARWGLRMGQGRVCRVGLGAGAKWGGVQGACETEQRDCIPSLLSKSSFDWICFQNFLNYKWYRDSKSCIISFLIFSQNHLWFISGIKLSNSITIKEKWSNDQLAVHIKTSIAYFVPQTKVH